MNLPSCGATRNAQTNKTKQTNRGRSAPHTNTNGARSYLYLLMFPYYIRLGSAGGGGLARLFVPFFVQNVEEGNHERGREREREGGKGR